MGSIDVNMPALSSTMKEGRIVSWSKKVGDVVSAGDILLVVESDKADMDVESFDDGYLAAIYTQEGESAAVGDPVAVLVENKEELTTFDATKPSTSTSASAASQAEAVVATSPNVTPVDNIPDFEAIMMPALSSTMKEGKIVSWSKNVGDKVESGDMILVVESDKADMDVESFEEGYLAAIIVPDGGIAEVGSPLGYLVQKKEDIDSVAAYAQSGGVGSTGSTSSTVSDSAPTPTPTAGTSTTSSTYKSGEGVINATPMARKLANENNLNIADIQGTGNFHRVTPDDVLKAAGKYVAPAAPASTTSVSTPSAPDPAPVAPIPAAPQLEGVQSMSGMQKAVAKNMEKTLDVPIFRVSREIVTDEFDALYAKLKPKGVTVSAMLAKAVAEVLNDHPLINAGYVEGGIKYNKDVNIAMAVALDGGLVTPTIVKANEMDLFSVGRKWKELVGKAKGKTLSPDEMFSGTFTISNLGMFGVQQFDAILPHGLGSILSIAASKPRVIMDKDGNLKTVKVMTVTITCDHRHIYGADAAEFLKDLANLLENNVESLLFG